MSTPQQQKERREYLIARNRCIFCARQDAYTLIGKRLCADCAQKQKEYNIEWREKNKERLRERKREVYKERSESGKCVKCGRKLDREGRKTCSRCANLQRKVDEKKVVNKNRGSNGLCWTCNKVPHEPGEKLCKACHDKMTQVAIENQKYINRGKHRWRKFDHANVLETLAKYSLQAEK